MSIIQVQFDHTLQQSDIVIQLNNSSRAEAQEAYKNNQPEIQQTHVYGIQAPLIMINSIVVDFSDVVSFELKSDKITPEVQMTVHDRYNLSTILDTPSIDNELRVQILPKFEEKYKKINLTFFITQMKINNGIIQLTGEYKVPKFTSSNIKSFGKISTHTLFQTIAHETGLGFATNIADNPATSRYIYCDNKSYKDLLKDEMSRSGVDNQIYDYWVDWWNNIVLADIYERYNSTDSDDDMQIWVSGQQHEMSEGSEIEPIKMVATFHNHPMNKNSELFVSNYKICNSPKSQMHRGTDRVYSIYEDSKSEYMDYLIQDGDTQKDVFIKYEYLGEAYGDYNYLLSAKKYETFKQKITSNETIEITISSPLLGVMRGNHVNFMSYINDSISSDVKSGLQEKGYISNEINTNIQLSDSPEVEDKSQDGKYELDKTISGQYLVTKCNMQFKDKQWKYIITLSRPTNTKPNIIND